jgi:putative MATE family efflux protein
MVISRLVGEGRVAAAEHVAGQTFVLGLCFSVLCALIGGLFAEPLVGLVVRDPGVIPLAVVYVRTAFLVLGGTLFIQLGSSVLNGAGDTTTPMFITLLMTPVGILGEWTLAFGNLGAPALGIMGIALGAGVGSAAGLAIMAWALASGRCRVHIRRRHLRPDRAALLRVVALSWQPALHMVARTTIIFFFMWLAGRISGKVQAAYTIGLGLEMPAFMIAFTIANSCATLVGQNLGAGRLDRAWRSIRLAFGLELALLWPISAALFLFRHDLVTWFTQDPEVAAMAAQYLLFSASIMVFYGLYFVSFRSLQAAGDMNSPMIISVALATLVGAPLGWALSRQTDLGATGMWIANLVYALLNALLMIGWLLTGRWTTRFGPGAAMAGSGGGGPRGTGR